MPAEQEKPLSTRTLRTGIRLLGAGVATLGVLSLNLVEAFAGLGIVWLGGKVGARDKQQNLSRV